VSKMNNNTRVKVRTTKIEVPSVLHSDHRDWHPQSDAGEVVDLVEIFVAIQPMIALDHQQRRHHIIVAFDDDPHPRITAAATRDGYRQVTQIALR